MSTTYRDNWIAFVLTWRIVLFIGIVLLASLTATYPAGADVGVLDGKEDFKLLASQGFAQAVDGPHQQGTAFNDYAWSMEWFKGALLVGTLRQQGTGQQLKAQIWRYAPAGTGGIAGTWKMVYQSGMFDPIDMGYRWMTVCDVGGTPQLYVTTMGTQRGRILYSNDGITFRQATTAGLKSSDSGYRPLVCFKDPGGKTLLITSPVGVGGTNFDSDLSNNPIVLATDNPISGTWRPYSPLRFGDSNNDSIFSIGALDTNGDGYGDTALYAGVSNNVEGGQVWKTSGCGPFPCVPKWTKIVDKGGGRPLTNRGFVQNAGISHFVQHNGAIYAAFSDRGYNLITAELIRINPDDSFELIIGQPRLNIDTDTIAGLYCPQKTIDGTDHDCPPLSGRGAGFGKTNDNYKDGTALYFWYMLSYTHRPVLFPQGDDRLYVGTLEGGFGPGATPGFDLLATGDDGLNWIQVTTDGLGDPNQIGARSMTASPVGLFVGGANADVITGNPGGCDVWLGTCDPALARPPVSDPRAVLKSTMPGEVIFDGQRYIAYDDENYPNPGDGKVAVSLESRSYDPFCGDIVDYRWDEGDLTGSCGSLPGNMGTTKSVGPFTLCTSSSNVGDCPDFTPSASTSDYNEYTFTLQVTDNNGNATCNKVVIRASKNLPPNVIVETEPPAVFSQGQWSVSLVDFDRNGSQTLTLRGMCTDPEGLSPLTCTWSADAGVVFTGKTLPFADADPAVLGAAYTATVPDGIGFSWSNIVLTAVDNLGNRTALPVSVSVHSSTTGSRPVCQGVSRTIAKNTVLVVNPATDTIGPRCIDPERQTLNYLIVTQPASGTGTVTGGTNLTYTPPLDFIGTAMFTLQACDPGGQCSSAVGVSVNVQDVPPPAPNPPASAFATILTGRTVRVAWTDVANETRYEVQRCRRSLFGGCSFSTIASNIAAGTTFLDNTVTSAGTYRFRVSACNAQGCSAYTQAPDVVVP